MKLVILALAVMAVNCGKAEPVIRPDLPRRVGSNWQLTGYVDIPPMPDLNPTMNRPLCWRASYSGPGNAQVELCGYEVEVLAFESFKRYPPTENAIKFHHDRYFVRVAWTGVEAITIDPLVEAIRQAVPHRRRFQKSEG